jgi:RNA polymerase sigma-70 factor (ECF subfamily)
VNTELPGTQDLIDQAKAGDLEAFSQICRIYEIRLLRQAMALCQNESLAEELAQDVLVESWKSLRRYNGRCQFFTWLCAILLHRRHHVLRGHRPGLLASRESDSEEVNGAVDEGYSPDETMLRHEQAALVQSCIESLPPKHQQVVYLRFYVDDSLESIATALGCSIGTVKSRLFNALEKLRAMNALNSQFSALISHTEKL